jgi:hypothetical protein
MKTSGVAVGRGRAGSSRGVSRKKFCRRCGTRVGRSAKKCGYCGRRLLSGPRLAAFAFAGFALLLFLWRLLGFG